jgi:hypothetical protein
MHNALSNIIKNWYHKKYFVAIHMKNIRFFDGGVLRIGIGIQEFS